MKDWTGDRNSVFKTLAASNHSPEDRAENDFYATEPRALELLLELEKFNAYIWEPACGQGHLSEVLLDYGYRVRSSDLYDRGYKHGENGVDFLKVTESVDCDILTNPPYKFAQQFVEHALSLIPEGNKVIMFLKLQFLEGQARRKLFDKYPPRKFMWLARD